MLLTEAQFAVFERGQEEGIAVGGKHDFIRLEAEGDDGHFCLGDGETVDNGIGDILIMHDLEHVGNHGLAGRVGGLQQGCGLHACGEQFDDARSPHLSKFLFVGLGIVEILAVDQTMAVAYEPYFASQTAVDHN